MSRASLLSFFASVTFLIADSQSVGRNSSPEFLTYQKLPMRGGDVVRAAETQEAAMLQRIKQHELEVQARQLDQRRQFEARFNQLVQSLMDFSEQYNQGKGAIWPRREADKLRKAMRELQQVETSLRDDPGRKSAPKARDPK